MELCLTGAARAFESRLFGDPPSAAGKGVLASNVYDLRDVRLRFEPNTAGGYDVTRVGSVTYRALLPARWASERVSAGLRGVGMGRTIDRRIGRIVGRGTPWTASTLVHDNVMRQERGAESQWLRISSSRPASTGP